MIEHARSGERQAHAEIKDKIDKIKTAKVTAADIKPQCGSSRKRAKAEGPTAAEQETRDPGAGDRARNGIEVTLKKD